MRCLWLVLYGNRAELELQIICESCTVDDEARTGERLERRGDPD